MVMGYRIVINTVMWGLLNEWINDLFALEA